jgi:hypothetical protein
MYWGENKLQIGCRQYTIEKWKSVFESVGRDHEYSDEQIKEYAGYINMIATLHESKAFEHISLKPQETV